MTRLPQVESQLRARKSAVLTRATLRAADELGLSQQTLARVLGVSGASITRLVAGKRALDPSTKEGELALLFLRVFRSLDSLVGGSGEAARAWLRAYNDHLGGTPAELILSIEGLARVAEYLDAMRGPI